MWEDNDLRSLVENDAREVLKPEETDSIAIIDDIRSHISASVKNLSDIEDAECRMLVVDRLLEELGLAAWIFFDISMHCEQLINLFLAVIVHLKYTTKYIVHLSLNVCKDKLAMGWWQIRVSTAHCEAHA